jgi:hypothetical protein
MGRYGVAPFSSGRILPLSTQSSFVWNTTAEVNNLVSTVIITQNFKRKFLIITNDSANAVFLAFGQPATVDNGVRLDPGRSYVMDRENLYVGYVAGISAAGALLPLTISEGMDTTAAPTTVTFAGTISRDLSSNEGPVYLVQHNLAAAGLLAANPLNVGQYLSGGNYNIYRLAVVFPTDAIPINARITAVALQLYCVSLTGAAFEVVVVHDNSNHAPVLPSNPVVVGDYLVTQYNMADWIGNLNTAVFAVGAYNNVVIYNTKTFWIQQGAGAVTRLLVMSGFDTTATAPLGDEYGNFGDANIAAGQYPRLQVTYMV